MALSMQEAARSAERSAHTLGAAARSRIPLMSFTERFWKVFDREICICIERLCNLTAYFGIIIRF